MIKLENDQFIGEGVYQKVYEHPSDANKCIKISKQDIKTTRLVNEIRYCEKISKKRIRKKDYQFFTKYYGTIETDQGKGYVFDLVRDETTGDISNTYEYYILNPDPSIPDDLLLREFARLIQLMAKYKIIANDIRAKNICCKILADKSIQLIHVDGLGHRDFLPFVNWFSYLAKKKIQRRLERFHLHDLDVQRAYLIDLYSKEDKA